MAERNSTLEGYVAMHVLFNQATASFEWLLHLYSADSCM